MRKFVNLTSFQLIFIAVMLFPFLGGCSGLYYYDAEYENSESAAAEVSKRIDQVESLADDLFDEWKDELKLPTSLFRISNSEK
jgi:TFIIF-interacting CTD phosphatase-like protein